jgi:Tol biopolymer transport system component
MKTTCPSLRLSGWSTGDTSDSDDTVESLSCRPNQPLTLSRHTVLWSRPRSMKAKRQLPIEYVAVTSVIVTALLMGCQTGRREPDIQLPLVTPVPGFTYIARTGAIYQVDVEGHKTQLLPADGTVKEHVKWSPDGQWLAYVVREWPLDDTGQTQLVQERLVAANVSLNTTTQLAGPARAIKYTWVDGRTIDLYLAHQLSDGSERQRWDQFLVDVETGDLAEVEQEEWHPPTPDPSSPDEQWSLAFEEQMGLQYVYLLDASGNKADTIYEYPADQDWTLAWSPDSRHLLYRRKWEREDVYIYDLTTGKSTNVTNFTASEQNEYNSIITTSWSPTGKSLLIRRGTSQQYEEPCIVYVSEYQLQCFDISSWSGQFVWSTDERYLGFIAPRSGPPDIYAVDVVRKDLLNLTQDGEEVVEIEIAR